MKNELFIATTIEGLRRDPKLPDEFRLDIDDVAFLLCPNIKKASAAWRLARQRMIDMGYTVTEYRNEMTRQTCAHFKKNKPQKQKRQNPTIETSEE